MFLHVVNSNLNENLNYLYTAKLIVLDDTSIGGTASIFAEIRLYIKAPEIIKN
jgi:hypothetical protein